MPELDGDKGKPDHTWAHSRAPYVFALIVFIVSTIVLGSSRTLALPNSYVAPGCKD